MDLNVNCPCGSARKFTECHGALQPAALVPATSGLVIGTPGIVQPPVIRKLDLAGGQNVREGFEGVDIWPGSKHVWNLMQYPWPFEDNSITALHCSHFAEHIPMMFVDDAGTEVPMGTPGAREALFRFFDECHRILIPDGWMDVIVPCARNDRGFQDPTHRRFFVAQTFFYLAYEWRKINKLDHYNVQSDWGVTCNPMSIADDCSLLSRDAQAHRFTHQWNTIHDWIAKIQKKPWPAPNAPATAPPATV